MSNRVLAAATGLLLAQRILDKHPANDSTKAFDRKLMAVELAENELRAAIKEETGIDPIEAAEQAEQPT